MPGFTLNGAPYFYLRNLQGDVVAIYDAAGNVVAQYEYDAWGNLLAADGSLAAVNPIRYRGYYWDSETKLYYLQSRYYNSEWGRFISADVYMDTQDGILGTNMYAYCQGDPVNFKDPSGFSSNPWQDYFTVLGYGIHTLEGVIRLAQKKEFMIRQLLKTPLP